MTVNRDVHRRRSIRLRHYDYASAGAYFVTICAQGRECLFGEVVDGEVRLSDAGRMIETTWDELSAHYPGVDTDAFVVMPNHVHGIIVLAGTDESPDVVGAGPRACPPTPARPPVKGQSREAFRRPVASTVATELPAADQSPGAGARPLSLPEVVHRFKTLTTKRYTDGVKQADWPPYPGRLWQRNYYEHVVRNEAALDRLRRYVENNPMRWELDEENPDRNR